MNTLIQKLKSNIQSPKQILGSTFETRSIFGFRISKFGFLITILHFACCLRASAQGTAFTYQGRLNDGGAPANGLYDLRFTIYDSTNLPGVVITGPLTNSTTVISNGLFMVALDFGAGVFTGPDRWLEIGVRTNGAGAFSALPARQLIAPTPYAINAANLGGGLHVDANNTNGSPNIIGGSMLNQIDPGFVGSVIAGGGTTNYFGSAYSNRLAGSYSAIGGGMGNLNQSFGSVISGGVLNQIQTGGSYDGIGSGLINLIEAGTDQSFIGGGYGNSIRSFARSSVISGGQLNTNGAPYSVIAGGQHNVIEWSADSATISGGANNLIRSNSPVSVITGGHDNTIQSAAFAFIGAGGYHQVLSNATDSSIVSGAYNTIQPGASESFIGNGGGNTIGTNSSYSSIVGGQNNSIQAGSSYAVIGGGFNNTIQSNASTSIIAGGHDSVIQNASFAFIGAGGLHQILSNAYDSAIVAGGYNTIQPNANGSFIGGGYLHTIQSNSSSSVIVGGYQNTIQTNSPYSTIGGGYLNTIEFNDFYSTIGGGGANTMETNASYSTIAGGINNLIQSNSIVSTIGGGNFNIIQSNAAYGTIPGGNGNVVAGPFGFAAGVEAQAMHAGAFVWADSQFIPFSSTTNDQFNVRAKGGVRFMTGGAGLTLDGQPILTTGSGAIGLSIQQNASGAPNVIEGAPNNFIAPGVIGATIGGGGATNYAGAGYSNSVTGSFGTVSSGAGNTASGPGSFVGGGGFDGGSVSGNLATGAASVIVGGWGNTNNGGYSFIGGGIVNVIQSNTLSATIGAGYSNLIRSNGNYATIAGGVYNTNDALGATIGGGGNNYAPSQYSTVAGGYRNTATGPFAVASGGDMNNSTGSRATVPGGYLNVATGDFSFAAGEQAQALHAGSFVWSDTQSPAFSSTISNQFSVRAANGLRLSSGGNGNIVEQTLYGVGGDGYQAINFNGYYDQATSTEQRFNTSKSRWRMVVDQRSSDLLTIDNFNGATVTNFVAILTNGNVGIGVTTPTNRLHVAGGVSATAFVSTSDRNAKENFAPISPEEVLTKVASLPISTWNFKDMKDGRHMGPMAQDFYAAFGLGGSDTTITTVDPDGVALAAIQGLNQKLEQKETEIAELKQRLIKLEQLINEKGR